MLAQLTPPTSLPSVTPLSEREPTPHQPTRPLTVITVQQGQSAKEFVDFIPSLSSAIVAVAVAVMVHRLTNRREKDKSVFELHRTLVDTAKEVRESASKGWTTSSKIKRESAILETRWQLQRVGAQANLIWRRSRSSRFMIWEHSVYLERRMAALRDSITLGDFADPTRNQRPSELTNVEHSISDFLDGLDAELLGWVDRSNRRIKPDFARWISQMKFEFEDVRARAMKYCAGIFSR